MPYSEKQEALLKKARLLPEIPGVYQMFSASGTLLYVGKSKALKNRVSSYFQSGEKSTKTARLVAQIADFKTIVTETEEEALLLENELIKLHKPKYNILLKDDKNYPYLHLSADEDYPRLSMRRKRGGDGGLYFGPYSSAAAVYEIIRTASTVFSLPRCTRRFPEDVGKNRPCLYHDMGRCMGLCTGRVSKEDYQKVISSLVLFLRHDHKKLIADLNEEMQALANEMRFEAAATVRDRLRAIEKLSEKQHVLAAPNESADVYALYADEVLPIVARLTVREGRLIDATHFAFSAAQIVSPEGFSSLLYDHYRQSDDLPRKILLSPELFDPEDTLLSELLRRKAGHIVALSSPKRGHGARLLELAKENAKKEAEHRKREQKGSLKTLELLAERLNLPAPPHRVEAYDISNHGNDSIYGGMVVAIDGKMRPSLYRSFSVEQTLKDDYAAMVEVLLRRMSHREEEGWETPDLVLLDGGMTHVSVVRRALSEQGFSHVPVFGMVKDEHHKTRTLVDESGEISIAKENALFGFVYSLQEEVHRYSLTCMDKNRRKKMLSSTLIKIGGIGAKKEKALLSHFKSIQKIREATAEELSGVRGISKTDAENIYRYFHN